MTNMSTFRRVRALVALAIAATALTAHALPIADGLDKRHAPDYTAANAPDKESRRVLLHYCDTLDCSPRPTKDREQTADAYAIHLNFAQIIEQNFAQVTSTRAREMVDDLSRPRVGRATTELDDIVRLYGLSVSASGHSAQLLPVLRRRLDAAHMGVVQTAFDNAQLAPPQGNWLDYTPQEIYLDLRTAPIGSLSVRAALLETGMFLGRKVIMAFYAGYLVGELLAPLIYEYDPSLYRDVQDIDNAANWITDGGYSWMSYGPAQQNLAQVFVGDGLLAGYAGSIEVGSDYCSDFGGGLGYDTDWGGHGGRCYPWTCLSE